MLDTKEAGLTRVLETLVVLCFAKKTEGGPFLASPVLERGVASKANMASMPRCPITPTGSEVSSPESTDVQF